MICEPGENYLRGETRGRQGDVLFASYAVIYPENKFSSTAGAALAAWMSIIKKSGSVMSHGHCAWTAKPWCKKGLLMPKSGWPMSHPVPSRGLRNKFFQEQFTPKY